MNYDKMTIESLAEYCHNKSGYAINKADLICRIEHLCRSYKDEQKQANEDVSPKRYGIYQSVICRLFGHKLKLIRNITPTVRELQCQRCGKQFGVNDTVGVMLPMDDELRRGHSVLLGGI